MSNNAMPDYSKSFNARSSPSSHKTHYSQYVDNKDPEINDWSEFDPNAVAVALSFSEEEIANLIIRLQNPLTGVKVTDCKWRSRKYSQCFSGQEGVKWFLENSKVNTIEEAEALGQRLLQCGAMRSLSNSPLPFQNNPFLYQLKGRKEIRDMDFMDELIKEYLLYRGLMETFTSFEKEIKQDKQSHQFEGSRIVHQLFSYVHDYNLTSLLELWKYIDFTLFSKLDQKYFHTVEKLELGIKRYYIVHAVQANRLDKVNEFFRVCGDQMSSNSKWSKWFYIPFVKNASKLAEFEVYFTKQWAENLSQSLTNFISTVLHQCTLPKILLYSTEKLIRKSLEAEIEDLKSQLERVKKFNISDPDLKKKMSLPTKLDLKTNDRNNISPPEAERRSISDILESPKPVILGNQRKSTLNTQPLIEEAPTPPPLSIPVPPSSKFLNFLNTTDLNTFSVVTQNVFRPTASLLRCCKFSSRGNYIAIGAAGGSVEVWQADDPNQIKATIYCFSDILSLAWQSHEDRILLCGTANGKIKVWDTVQAVMIADIKVHLSYPKITSISFSSTSSSFICSVCSSELLQSIILSFDLETMKIINEISPEINYHITCVKYNSTSTRIVCGGSNGYLSIYDIAASNWNTWKGHDADVLSVVFHKSSSYLLSIGKDGKLLQWSYASTEKPVLQYQYDHLANVDAKISFSSSNEYFIVNSGHLALVYRFNEPRPIHRIDGNQSMMVDIDWHPFLDDTCLTATSDSLVQITKLVPKPTNPYIFSH